MDPSIPAHLAELSKRASKDWSLPPRSRHIAPGLVLGGETYEFTNGTGQTQIASFTVPRLALGDERNAAAIQAANAELAVEGVRFVRQALATGPGHQGEPLQWTYDMVNMACATVFMRTGVHVDAEDMRAGIERAIATR